MMNCGIAIASKLIDFAIVQITKSNGTIVIIIISLLRF